MRSKPFLNGYHNSQIKNALVFLHADAKTDQGFCRVQAQCADMSVYRVKERVVIISSMFTEILPERRLPWSGVGKWAVQLPPLRCCFRPVCLVVVTSLVDTHTHRYSLMRNWLFVCGLMARVRGNVLRWRLWASDPKSNTYSGLYAAQAMREVCVFVREREQGMCALM